MTATTSTLTALGYDAVGDPAYDQAALAAGIFRPATPQGCGTCGCSGRVRDPRTGRSRTCSPCGGSGRR